MLELVKIVKIIDDIIHILIGDRDHNSVDHLRSKLDEMNDSLNKIRLILQEKENN